MINIRKGLFETNSSSVHSLVMCTKDEYNKWKNGELIFDWFSDSLVDVKEVELSDTDGYLLTFEGYDKMLCDKYYEHFYQEKDGMVAFGYYGHDQ